MRLRGCLEDRTARISDTCAWAGELPLGPDVVDVVVRDLAEHGTETSHNPGLLTVEDDVVAYGVGPDLFSRPAGFERTHNDFVVMRGAILPRIVDPDIVAGLAVLAQADAHAFGVADDVVLDDPALAPVGADESDLLGGRGRPLGSGLAHVKTAHRNIVAARLVRVEATVAPHPRLS